VADGRPERELLLVSRAGYFFDRAPEGRSAQVLNIPSGAKYYSCTSFRFWKNDKGPGLKALQIRTLSGG
jgi:hypothetical protein